MRCSSCGFDNPMGKRYCSECGARLPQGCPRCGAIAVASAKFCGECGARLDPQTGATLAETAPSKVQEVDGERRHLTVLFSDLVGSTEISARLDPEELREFMAAYHAAAAITRFGGLVAKYLGDGVMAYFGWPEAHDNDAERAARAGLALLDSVAELNLRSGHKNLPKLSVRVGIDSGTVVIGKGGGSESEVFGDTANIASRVQSATQPNTVVVTPAVNRLVSGLFVVEEIGAHQLKGIAEVIELYRVIGLEVVPSLISLATDSISSARARTRMSSVKFIQRTVPDESRRNSAGREISCFSGPPPTCNRLPGRGLLGKRLLGCLYLLWLGMFRLR